MSKHRNRDAAFKARVALEAVKGERTVSELAAEYGAHPTMIHQWKRALLDGAADIFERDGKKAPEIDEDTIRVLHAKIGELAVANDFFCRESSSLGSASGEGSSRHRFKADPEREWSNAHIPSCRSGRSAAYLVAVMDWFTRKVLAWRISNTLEADFCVEALNEAIHKFGPPEIMNIDQGSQFTSFAWTDRLKRVGTQISMEGKERCLDNIFIERLWRSLKYEGVYLHACETGSQARTGIGRWITFYNHHRPHTAHGGQPPAVVHFNTIETDKQVQAVA
ncbi:transposase [Paracoccus lutimaris]|uniref:Transposase n=1 Tax=Paracoccus lutimaris TaxID=1490030 RepID=A0A368Z3Y9_9RHOB|nr:IS3 family transposase [Paracoccus lutimaris]RCW87172.1 transposase [Paracoccus lutimaris]